MIVWIVRKVWPFDGSIIEKVFLDEEDAKKYCKGHEEVEGDYVKPYLEYNCHNVVM